MPNALPAIELLPRPASGRVFTAPAKVRLGDVDRDGSARLDAIARWLQDTATDDAADAGLDRRYGWLVRRTLIEVSTPPTLGESIAVSTWCSGIGRSWAERRSQVVGTWGALVDAVSLWVQVDVDSGRPTRVADDFMSVYGQASAGRTVSSRLSLRRPMAVDSQTKWSVRQTDIDPFGHVNNAATWAFVEEHLPLGGRRGRAELEYLTPLGHGDALGVVTDRDSVARSSEAWLLGADGVAVAARWSPTT